MEELGHSWKCSTEVGSRWKRQQEKYLQLFFFLSDRSQCLPLTKPTGKLEMRGPTEAIRMGQPLEIKSSVENGRVDLYWAGVGGVGVSQAENTQRTYTWSFLVALFSFRTLSGRHCLHSSEALFRAALSPVKS